MNEKVKELIALGASVSAHCFPCLDYHLGQLKKLNASDEEIHEAILMGISVMNGSGEKMIEKIRISVPGTMITGSESCCSD